MARRPMAEIPAAPIPFQFAPGGFLLVISGPSGAGKGTLVDRLVALRPQCVFSVSATTRPRRDGESDGVQYEFVSRVEFERRRSAGLFLEWAEVHGHLYATPARFVDEGVRAGHVVVLDVDVQGGASVRRARSDAVSVFVHRCPAPAPARPSYRSPRGGGAAAAQRPGRVEPVP